MKRKKDGNKKENRNERGKGMQKRIGTIEKKRIETKGEKGINGRNE